MTDEEQQEYANVQMEMLQLVKRKGEDYNDQNQEPLERYFPFGAKSYVQMIWVKVLRVMSLTKYDAAANFESVYDSLLDMANYIIFFAIYMRKRSLNLKKPVPPPVRTEAQRP